MILIYCQAQLKLQLKLSWAEFSLILTLSNIYVAAAPIYVAAAPIYVAAAPIYVAAAHNICGCSSNICGCSSGKVPKVLIIDFFATVWLFADTKCQSRLIEEYSDTYLLPSSAQAPTQTKLG